MNIYMWDEASDSIVESQAQLNLKNGSISNIVYLPLHDFYNQKENEPPFSSDNYEKTMGSLNIQNKNIDFKIDTKSGSYLVEPEELKKIHNIIASLGINLEDLDNTLEKKHKP